MDDLNWIATGGSFGRQRRFPTFTVSINQKTGMLIACDDQDNGRFKTCAATMEQLEKVLRPYVENRTRMA